MRFTEVWSRLCMKVGTDAGAADPGAALTPMLRAVFVEERYRRGRVLMSALAP